MRTVRIDPFVADDSSVWEAREKYVARKGRLKEDFVLPSRDAEVPTSSFEDWAGRGDP